MLVMKMVGKIEDGHIKDYFAENGYYRELRLRRQNLGFCDTTCRDASFWSVRSVKNFMLPQTHTHKWFAFPSQLTSRDLHARQRRSPLVSPTSHVLSVRLTNRGSASAESAGANRFAHYQRRHFSVPGLARHFSHRRALVTISFSGEDMFGDHELPGACTSLPEARTRAEWPGLRPQSQRSPTKSRRGTETLRLGRRLLLPQWQVEAELDAQLRNGAARLAAQGSSRDSTPDDQLDSSTKAMLLYLELRERMQHKLDAAGTSAADASQQWRGETAAPPAAMAFALTSPFLLSNKASQRQDRIEAGRVIRELKARCAHNIEVYRRQQEEAEDLARREAEAAGYKKSGVKLWMKTRLSFAPGGLLLANSARRRRSVADVADKVAFFQEYHRIRHGCTIGGSVDPETLAWLSEEEGDSSSSTRRSFILGCLRRGIYYPEPLLKNDKTTEQHRVRRLSRQMQALKEQVRSKHESSKKGDSDKRIDVNLSHYGMGDPRAHALGDAMASLSARLGTLDISSNRLSAEALTRVVRGLCDGKPHALTVFDCSRNSKSLAHASAGEAIGALVAAAPNLSALRLAATGLSRGSLRGLVNALLGDNAHAHSALRFLDLSQNDVDDGEAIARLVRANTVLDTLNLAWNRLGDNFGSQISEALLSIGASVRHLDLSHNSVSDAGAEAIAAGLNGTLLILCLAWNKLGKRSALVFAHALWTHNVGWKPRNSAPALKHLDLSGNAVGRDGVRAFNRRLLMGMQTEIVLRDCSISHKTVERRSKKASGLRAVWTTDSPPSADELAAHFGLDTLDVDGSYVLDLGRAYDRAVATEIAKAAGDNRARLRLVHREFPAGVTLWSVRDDESGVFTLVASTTPPNAESLGQEHTRYYLPENGVCELQYEASTTTSATLMRHRAPITRGMLHNLVRILAAEPTRAKRLSAASMLATELAVTTVQVQQIIDELRQLSDEDDQTERVDAIDILSTLWTRIVDERNKLDLLSRNVEVAFALRDMRSNSSYEEICFCESNPTGHWKLDLSQASHRVVLSKLLDVAAAEKIVDAEAGRDPTSQDGDVFTPFRNCSINRVPKAPITEPAMRDLVVNNPDRASSAVVEFDYVSIVRPPHEDEEHHIRYSEVTKIRSQLEAYMKRCAHPGQQQELSPHDVEDDELSTASTASGDRRLKQLEHFSWKNLVLVLRLATLGKYLTARHVLMLVDFVTSRALTFESFDEDREADALKLKQSADVVVTLFARLWDLENMDVVLTQLPLACVDLVAQRLGWLNIANPFKLPTFVALDLRHRDNRCFAHHLLVLATQEGTDKASALDEEPNSEITIANLYERLGSMVRSVIPAMLRVQYKDDLMPNYRARFSFLRSFLLGSKPLADRIFDDNDDLRRAASSVLHTDQRSNSSARLPGLPTIMLTGQRDK